MIVHLDCAFGLCINIYCCSCIDINECTAGTHNCHPTLATCTNTPGSFTCQCIAGFNGDGVTCTSKWIIVLCFRLRVS